MWWLRGPAYARGAAGVGRARPGRSQRPSSRRPGRFPAGSRPHGVDKTKRAWKGPRLVLCPPERGPPRRKCHGPWAGPSLPDFPCVCGGASLGSGASGGGRFEAAGCLAPLTPKPPWPRPGRPPRAASSRPCLGSYIWPSKDNRAKL